MSGNSRRHLCTQRNIRFSALMMAILAPSTAFAAQADADDPALLFTTLCAENGAKMDAVEKAARKAGFVTVSVPVKPPPGMTGIVALERDTGTGRLALVASTGTSAVLKDVPDQVPVRSCTVTLAGREWDVRGFARAWVGVEPLLDVEGTALYSYFERAGGNAVADNDDLPRFIAGVNAGEVRTLAAIERDGASGLSWVVFETPATPIRLPDPQEMARRHESEAFAPCKWEGRGKARSLMCPSETGKFEQAPARGVTEATPASARGGDLAAMLKMAVFYADGPKSVRDPASSAMWSRKAADGGAAEGAFNLGLAYQAGFGVAADRDEAMRWYRSAADRQFAPAMINLAGLLLDQTAGEDGAAALELVRAAADAGSADAMFDMGHLHENGIGAARDMVEAMRWYRLAADKKDSDARRRLGLIHADGIGGVARDEAEGVRWLIAGVKPSLGIAEALAGMQAIIQGFDDPKRRASLTAAAESNPELALQLGLHFVNRSRASREPVEAMRLFRIAAKAGKAAAVLEMGILYGEGDGVERNDAEALRLLRMDPNLRTSGAFRRVTRLIDAPAR